MQLRGQDVELARLAGDPLPPYYDFLEDLWNQRFSG